MSLCALCCVDDGTALKYRLWIYNGQEDGCIPYTGAEEWTSHQGFPVATAWHPWFGACGTAMLVSLFLARDDFRIGRYVFAQMRIL